MARRSIVAILLLPTLAIAQDEAAARYQAGREAFEAGDTARAVEELRASIAARPSAKTWLLLGNALTRANDLDGVKQAFEAFLVAEPKSPKRRTVEKLIGELAVLAKTKLAVTSAPPGATVFLDLRAEGARGKTPLALPAVPGRHRVMLELDGYEPASQEVKAVEGEIVPVAVELHAKTPVAVEPSPGATLSLRLPARATASLDGKPIDAASSSIELLPGKHQLAVEPPPLPTTIEVVPEPADALVRIDRKAVGVGVKLAIAPGEHALWVGARGHEALERSLTVGAGERLRVQPRLEPRGRRLLALAIAATATGVALESMALAVYLV